MMRRAIDARNGRSGPVRAAAIGAGPPPGRVGQARATVAPVGMAFGPIWQLGYVVADVEAAMRGWLVQGVGPWYLLDPFAVDRFSFR